MTPQDLHRVNMLISRSFTQGRFDDGYQMTHVPMCRPEFLEMYYWSCPDGCFVIEEKNKIIAASFCHVWGEFGWIGPLAVAPESHLLGFGKEVAKTSIEYLKKMGCKTIGLEANPRSSRSMGFYAKLNLFPQSLSIDVMRKVPKRKNEDSPHKVYTYSKSNQNEKLKFLAGVRHLCQIAVPNIDYSSLIENLDKFKYGESILYVRNNVPIAVAILQTVPTSTDEDPTLLRLVAFLAHPKTPDSYWTYFIRDIETLAQNKNLQQILIRVPTSSPKIVKFFLQERFRIIFSDIRLTLEGYPESPNPNIFHASRWA
jgi:GNAT superfamily N-acetyltransferase